MVYSIIIFLPLTAGYLASIVHLYYPPSSTPLHLFDWSYKEDTEMLTELGKSSLVSETQNLIENYKDLFSEEENLIKLYIKSNKLGKLSSEAISSLFNLTYEIIDTPKEEDYLLSPETSCKRILWLMLRDRLYSKSYSTYWQTLEPFLSNYSQLIGQDPYFYNIYLLGDSIISYQTRKIELPSILSEESKIAAIDGYHKYNELLIYGSREQGKLATHAFISYLIEMTQSENIPAINLFVPDKALLYAISKNLGLDEYSGSLTIEIHSLNNKFFKFIRNGEPVTIQGCGEECEISEFKKNLEKRMYKSTKSHIYACKTVEDYENKFGNFIYYALIAGVVFIGFFCNIKLALWTVGKFFSNKKPDTLENYQ